MFEARAVPERVEDRLIVALDLPDVAAARNMVQRLEGIAGFFKLGLWLAYAPGFEGLVDDLIEAGNKIFLDTKMFDIGETVRHGVMRAAERGVSFVTVHGHRDIVKAAALGKAGTQLKVLVVPVLTSLDAAALRELGYASTPAELIAAGARTAWDCGCDGIVAAPQDDPNAIRRAVGASGLLVVTPGVRLPGGESNDHRRSGTPAEAIAGGADYLVVGRPIVRAADPAIAAMAIIADMRRGLQP